MCKDERTDVIAQALLISSLKLGPFELSQTYVTLYLQNYIMQTSLWRAMGCLNSLEPPKKHSRNLELTFSIPSVYGIPPLNPIHLLHIFLSM